MLTPIGGALAGRSLSAQIFDAVCSAECTLSAEARHAVMVLVWAGDSTTATGFSGQETLAGKLGKSARQLRRLIDEINTTPGSPVTVDRTPRFRKDGRGRTSDAYAVRLTNGTPMSGCSALSTGRGRPLEDRDQSDAGVPLKDAVNASLAGVQPATHVPLAPATNRTPEDVQPDMDGTTNRTPTSGHRSTKRSTKRSTMCRASWKRVPETWVPNDQHRALASELGVHFETELANFRDFDFTRPKKDPDATFRTWLRKACEFQQRGGGRRALPQQGTAERVRVSTAFDA